MSLFRYALELRGLCDELLDLVSYEDREFALSNLEPQFPHPFLPLSQKRRDETLRFLTQQPSQRRKTWAKLDQQQQVRLWCTARYLALLSANAAQLALDVAEQCDGPYRQALGNVASVALQPELSPSAQEIAHARLA